ncbi:MAG: ferritin-like domain-containing protein [Planctomycetota bacterium]|jgi:hypothetical protein
MLLTREEMTFDFQGGTFDLERDRELLAWIFNQFLYGEVTGIQVGHWIQEAPNLEAADFFAKQCIQELQHIRAFKRCFEILGVPAAPAHRALRMMSSDFIGGNFEEHVALEMAQGEGFVLLVFYALIDTIDHPEISKLLKRAAPQEEEHCGFGEAQTIKAIQGNPKLRDHLLGLNLAQLGMARRFAGSFGQYLPAPPDHPVLKHLDAFVRFGLDLAEVRLQRMGLLEGKIADIGALRRIRLSLGSSIRRYGRVLIPFRRRPKRLTDTYLSDPGIVGAANVA